MKYKEIINHPHYEPKKHPRMSREMRAGHSRHLRRYPDMLVRCGVQLR